MSAIFIIVGLVIITYMAYLENQGPFTRPLAWGEVTMTIGCIVGFILLSIGIYLKL